VSPYELIYFKTYKSHVPVIEQALEIGPRSVSRTLWSDRMFKNGDCWRSATKACFSVSSNTGSQVLLSMLAGQSCPSQ